MNRLGGGTVLAGVKYDVATTWGNLDGDDTSRCSRCPVLGGEGGRNMSILPAAPLRPWHSSEPLQAVEAVRPHSMKTEPTRATV